MTDLQQFVPVLTAAVAAAAALAGAFGGPWLKARTDVDQWRRQQRLDAYAEVVRAAQDAVEIVLIEQFPDISETQWETLRHIAARVMQADARVQLLAPPAMQKSSRRISDYVNADLTGRTDVPDEHADPTSLQDFLDEFMKAARRDLGSSKRGPGEDS